MFSAKSMKHPHPTRLTSTLGKVLRFGFGARVKLGDGPFNEESSGRNNNDTGSEEKKVAGEKQEDKVPIVGNKRPLSDNEKALGGESDPHPLPPLPYHPERSDTQESEERPIVAAQVQDHDPVEHLPPEYEHAVHDKPESVVEDAQVEPTQEEAPEQEDRSPSPVEYFEARAAYDFVDDEEPLEEYDGDSPTSSPLNRSSRRVSGTRVITGEGTIDEDGEGDEAYDAGESDMEWDDDRIYEARFRLTPCVEFEEGDEDEGEDIVVGETANMGVDKEAEAELEEAWLAVLGEQRRIANERERQALTEGGQVVVHAQAQATEKTKKRDRELKAGEKAEHMPMSAAVQSSDISLGPSPLSTPPYVDPPQNEEAQAVAQPVEEAMSAAKERKTEEREMTPEEEASLVAHWERQRVVYERHANTLERILSSSPSNKAWLQRSGLNVDELLRCLRWTPEGFEDTVQEVQALSLTSSLTTGSPPMSSSSSKEKSSDGLVQSEGARETEDIDGGQRAKQLARQKKLRELRKQHRRNARRLLENTRKVDQMMAILTDLLRGMSEAAEKKRAERRREKEREKERDRERRRKAAEEVRRKAAVAGRVDKGKEREKGKEEKWMIVEKPVAPSEDVKIPKSIGKEKEKGRQRTKVIPQESSMSTSTSKESSPQHKAGPSKPRRQRPPVSPSGSSQHPQPLSTPPSPILAPKKRKSIRDILRPSASSVSGKSKPKDKPSRPPAKRSESKKSKPIPVVDKEKTRPPNTPSTQPMTTPPRLPPTPDYASTLGVDVNDWLASQALLKDI